MSIAAAHNGGRSQVNLNFLQESGDFPWINQLKGAQSWTLVDNSGVPAPNTLNSDGYPTTISNGGVYTAFFVPTQAERSGNYIATWSGNGTIYCGMSNTLVSGSKTSSSGSGRYVFSTTDNEFLMGIASIGSPIITNLQVFHQDDEALLDAGEVFGTKFKQRLAQANFGVIRFLNWQDGNFSNVTTWATRKPQTYVFYAGSEFRSSIYAGVTAGTGTAYTATLGGFSLVDKAMVTVQFDRSQSAACTLNVSGTGDINILDNYARALSSPDNSFPVANKFATLVYDQTLNAFLKLGGDLGFINQGIDNAAPPELMLQLCAELGAHPYFVTPYLTIDPASDYMTSLATYCQENAPSWMIPRFEGCNELWNGEFPGTSYATAKAAIYWSSAGNYNEWYGKTASVLGQIVSTVYGGDRTKYQVLCGVQTGLGGSPGDSRLTAAQYIAQAAAPQSPFTKTAASAWVTHVCCAQYITPSDYGTGTETTLAANFAGGDLTAPATYVDTLNSGGGEFELSAVLALYVAIKAWAQGFGIQKMCGYEGGYSPDYTSLGASQVDLLRAAGKLVTSSPGSPTGLQGYTTTNYENFVGLTDGTFTAEFPSCFQFSGTTPSNNAWSVLEDIYQSPDPPQWLAIVAFNTPAPVVTSISPVSGDVAGGTPVSITGQFFTGATSATVGGDALTGLSVISDTQVDGTTGAHSVGTVDVVVTTSQGSGTGSGLYQYTQMQPAAGTPGGPMSGGYFSRGKWHKLLAEMAAEAQERTAMLSRRVARDALANATKAAVAIAKEADTRTVEERRMKLIQASLKSAMEATKTAEVLRHTEKVTRHIAELKRQIDEDDDEEEAVTLLLLH